MQHCCNHIQGLDLRHNHVAANVEQTDIGCCCAMWQTWLHNFLTKFDPILKFFKNLRGKGCSQLATEKHHRNPGGRLLPLLCAGA